MEKVKKWFDKEAYVMCSNCKYRNKYTKAAIALTCINCKEIFKYEGMIKKNDKI